MMATVHAMDGRHLHAVKGAPEAVLAAATHLQSDDGAIPMDAPLRREWAGNAERLAGQGLRVIACASKIEGDAGADPYDGLTFLGLVGLEDPARPDVPAATQACRRAGI